VGEMPLGERLERVESGHLLTPPIFGRLSALCYAFVR